MSWKDLTTRGGNRPKFGGKAVPVKVVRKKQKKKPNLPKNQKQVERKMFEIIASGTVNSTGSIQLISNIDGGSDESTRVGNKIYLKYLMARTSFQIHASATTTFVRLIYLATARLGNNTPTVAQVLETASHLAPISSDNSNGFTILADILVALSQTGPQCAVRKTFRRLNFEAKYVSATASTGFDQGNVWLLTISNEATNAPTVVSYARLVYTDS